MQLKTENVQLKIKNMQLKIENMQLKTENVQLKIKYFCTYFSRMTLSTISASETHNNDKEYLRLTKRVDLKDNVFEAIRFCK